MTPHKVMLHPSLLLCRWGCCPYWNLCKYLSGVGIYDWNTIVFGNLKCCFSLANTRWSCDDN